MKDPGVYRSYPSRMVSPFYCWFVEMGYPELDVRTYDDGEWSIIQYMNRPIIPSLTRWNFVLKGIRNTEITYDFCKKYAEQLDLEKRTVWEEQEKQERRMREQADFEERRANDMADQWLKGIVNNPALMERIAKNGLKEVDPRRMLNHISRSKLGKGYVERS